ncbi:Dna2/Cas4 domain-containing protein [Methanoculleus sp. FWC-SCC1]|uniref:DNA 3'-5' helicase n=1 Tax=Methanoculleus frigidifontis TaxID=2584085 RepID=A0ABT8MDN6_9EURY|nr:UvrD-helicase domain-containing protein [Methanoculleus sp. FWC-SCC1]MDN7026011.1 Dna2/Cas4 domain-containing protein [Methanoculleus sp. FWC-SCC1]
MGLRFFRGRRGEHGHEHRQLKEIVAELREEYDDETVFVLTNVRVSSGELDCVVLAPGGPVILELKAYQGEIIGLENGVWEVRTAEGAVVPLRKNLFEQLERERFSFLDKLLPIREKHFPEIDEKYVRRVGAWGYFEAGSGYPDGQVNTRAFPWFAIVTAQTLLENLRFNATGYTLLPVDMEAIVQELRLEEYDPETDRAVPAEEPVLPAPRVKAEPTPAAPVDRPDPSRVRLPRPAPPQPCTAGPLAEEQILESPKPLSPSQREAVLSQNTSIRIIAGAGAGKTETLTRKIVHLLLVEQVDPASIVAFTFTKKAAQSMKSRIYDRVAHLGGEEACSRLGEMYIGTIHAYCLSLLRDACGYGNWGELDENQEMAFLLRVGWDCHFPEGGNYPRKCEAFLKNLNVVYAEMLDRTVLREQAPGFSASLEAYEDALARHRRLTFNRMIHIAVEQLERHPGLAANVRYLIVDEYQDINRAQERLIQLLGTNARTFVVGDPRQTIYQWRGSDERCFEQFAEGLNPDEVTIAENRRSGTAILDVANTVADGFAGRRYDPLAAFREVPGGVYLVGCRSDLSEAEWIADQIKRYVDAENCRYSDIGILLRSVTTSAPVLIDEFRKRGIPFVVGGKVGLFRRPEVLAVAKLFMWVVEGGYFQKSRYDFNEVYIDDDLLRSGCRDWKEVIPGGTLPGDIGERLSAWKAAAAGEAFPDLITMYYDLLNTLSYQRFDPQDPGDAVALANLGKFAKLLTDFESINRFGGAPRDWNQLLAWLCEYVNAYATSAYDEQSPDDVRGVEAVQIMTVHQAKGLEWPVVFVPAIVDGRFPSGMIGKPQEWLIPRELFDAEKYEGDLESERKLFYVAVTRARDLLVASCFASQNGRPKRMSVFAQDFADSEQVTFLEESDALPFHPLSATGETDEIQTYTAGELITYGKCPHLYRLRQIWGYEPPLSDLIGYGKALHACMGEAAEMIRAGQIPVSAVARAVDQHFFMPYVDGARLEKLRADARAKLLKFSSDHTEDMRGVREIEARIEFPMEHATVAGRVDLVLQQGDGLEVRDYKTSGKVVTPEEAALQVRLYALGLTTCGEQVGSASLAFLQDSSVVPVSVDADQLDAARTTARTYIQGINNREFPAQPGPFCLRCDYGPICRWKAR